MPAVRRSKIRNGNITGIVLRFPGHHRTKTLRRSRRGLRPSLLNPNPIIEVDNRGKVYFLNPAAQRLFPELHERRCNHPWLADWKTVVRMLSESGTGIYTRDIPVGEKWYQQAINSVSGTSVSA